MTSVPHILVVDDDENISTLLTGFFRKHGHQVTVTANGAAMFQALEAQQADLVFLDVMLLGEDGFSLCRRLRTASKVPVIQLVAGFSGPSNLPGARHGAGFLAAVSDRLESSFLVRQNGSKLPWASNSHAIGAYSADPDQPFRPIAITDSGDPDHAVHCA
jgi:CheY-like chemotaxis protein